MVSQRVGQDRVTFTFTCMRVRLWASVTNSFFVCCVAAWEGLHVLLLNWAEWMRQRECLDSPQLPTPWNLVHCSNGPVISPGERTQICSNESILGKKAGLSQSPGSPGAQRYLVHMKSVWGSPITCLYSSGGQTLGFCQHWDGCLKKATGLVLFFCHPWRALSLKPPVSFQRKSNKYLEANNPIWKSVGNSVSTFSGSA